MIQVEPEIHKDSVSFLELLQVGLSVKVRERNTELHSMRTNAFRLALQLFDVIFEFGHFVQRVPSFATVVVAVVGGGGAHHGGK